MLYFPGMRICKTYLEVIFLFHGFHRSHLPPRDEQTSLFTMSNSTYQKQTRTVPQRPRKRRMGSLWYPKQPDMWRSTACLHVGYCFARRNTLMADLRLSNWLCHSSLAQLTSIYSRLSLREPSNTSFSFKSSLSYSDRYRFLLSNQKIARVFLSTPNIVTPS